MRNYAVGRKASDPDRTNPERAVASIQGIAAAWLLVLAAALVALLPNALSIAEAAAARTAYLARAEVTEVLRSMPSMLQPHDLIVSQGLDTADILGDGAPWGWSEIGSASSNGPLRAGDGPARDHEESHGNA
jgi:hypothetical protein